MIDLHTHTLYSDGDLLPAELIRRAEVMGYTAIGLTDHADSSNLDFVIPRLAEACRRVTARQGIAAVPGVELTHVHPEDIAELAGRSRSLGARLVIVHGETIAEPVSAGTNTKALEADIDILAHPGLISDDDVRLAARRGICLEISARKGHSLANGLVADRARRFGARLVLNTDAHGPDDLIAPEKAERIARGAGLAPDEVADMFANSRAVVRKALGQ